MPEDQLKIPTLQDANATGAAPTALGRRKLRRIPWRWVARGAAVCLVMWLGLVIYVDWAMRQTPEEFGRIMAHMPMPAFLVLPFETLWTHERAGHLNAGE